MTDIASLGLEIRSDGVVVATDRLKAFERRAESTGAAANTLKRLWQASLAAVAAGFAAFGVGIAGAVRRLEDMRRMSLQVDQALKNSGNSARTSAREIEAWADRLEQRTGRAAEDVMAVAANLASFGFGRSEFFRSLELANDMAAAWGGDLKQNLEGLARALDDPLNGMAMLSKRGIKLSEDQKAMAAAFLDANDKVGAQGVVFDALEAQVKGVAEAGFGGLSAAFAKAQKAWDDAFEDLVRGDGTVNDFRETLQTLAETVSSPEFISAVMGFGNILVQGMTAVANAVVWAWGKMQEFLAWLKGQQPANLSSESLESRIDSYKQDIAAAEKKLSDAGPSALGTAGHDAGGWFGTKLGAAEGIENMRRQLQTLLDEQASRAAGDPIGSGAGPYGDMLTQFRTPGSMAGETPFNPYEGMDFTTEATQKKAEKMAEQMHQMWQQLDEDLKPLLTTIDDPFVELQGNLDKLGAWLQHEGPAGWEAYSEGVKRANLIATSSVLGSVGQITGILSGAFEDNKLLAAANAAVNTAEGVTKALAQGGMFAWPTAIAIGAAGAVQIANIMSAKPGSSKVATVGGSADTSTAPAAQPQARTASVSLVGDYFSRDAVSSLFDRLNDELGVDGLQIVTTHKQA